MIDYTPELDTNTDETLVVRRMPANVYHGLDRLNAGKVAAFAQSMVAGEHELNRGTEPTMSMRFGTAVHARLLEPADFAARAVEYDDIGPGSNAKYTAAEEANATEGRDEIILAKGWRDQIEAMRLAAHRNEFAKAVLFGLEGAHKEITILWTEQYRGEAIRCKARLDYFHAETRQVMDIKTTRDADPMAFEKQIGDLMYHVKGAWYCHAAMRAGLCDSPPDMVWIAMSNNPPYVCQPVKASGDMLDQGMEQMGLGVRRWQAHKNNQPDPVPPSLVYTASLKPWHQTPPGMYAAFELGRVQ